MERHSECAGTGIEDPQGIDDQQGIRMPLELGRWPLPKESACQNLRQ